MRVKVGRAIGEKFEVGVDEYDRQKARRKKKLRKVIAIIFAIGFLGAFVYLLIGVIVQLVEEPVAKSEPEVVAKKLGIKVIDRESGREGVEGRLRAFLLDFEAVAGDFGLKIEKVETVDGKTRELAIFLVGRKEYYKVQVDRGAGETAEDISRMVKYLDEKKLVVGYVDVRIRGRAYYR